MGRNGSTIAAAPRLALAAMLACVASLIAAAPAPAAAWLSPVDLSQPPRSASNVDVAMDAAGDLVAVWERSGFPSTPIQASVRWGSVGSDYSGPIELTPTGTSPQVAMFPWGGMVAAFTHFDPGLGKNLVQVRELPVGGGLSPPETVAELPSGFSVRPKIAVSSVGVTCAVAWLGRSAENKHVVFVSTSSTGAFEEPVELSDPAHDASEPELAVDPAGTVTVVWKGYSEAAGHDVVQASRGSGTTFSPPEDVSEADAVGDPDVALGPSGQATVVFPALEEKPEEEWAEPGTPEYFPAVIEASDRPPGGGFEAPVQLSAADEAGFQPRVEIGADDTAVVAWVTSGEGLPPGVLAAVRQPGGAFEAPQRLSGAAAEARSPELAVNRSGAATVVWETTGAATAQASTRPPGGAFSPPVDLSSGGAIQPDVAMDDAGDAIAVWARSNGSSDIAQAAAYDVTPPELRNLSVPAQGRVGEPVSFSVEPFDLWSLAASGFDFGDGSAAAGSSVSHTYTAPGSYRVTASARDAAGAVTSAGATIRILATGRLRLGKLRRNRRTGRAVLVVHVPGPGRLVLRGRGVKKVSRRARAAGAVRLPVRAVGRAAKRLRKRGKVRVRLHVAFVPDGGGAEARARTAVLKKARTRRQHRHR